MGLKWKIKKRLIFLFAFLSLQLRSMDLREIVRTGSPQHGKVRPSALILDSKVPPKDTNRHNTQ